MKKEGCLAKTLQSNLFKVIIINLAIFILTNLIFAIKYEQVDDFIIYNLYSGLDGTYNFHGIYIHPILCSIIGLFFRFIPSVNWHTIFLLSMQFICFTIIGTILLNKHKNSISIILYTVFAGIFYTALLLLLQYTSVAALLILTAFFIMISQKEQNKKCKIACFVLYMLGIMIRMQSLLIILPFFALYGFYYFRQWLNKTIHKKEFWEICKTYGIFAVITIAVYLSSYFIYHIDKTYQNYMEYNDIRATLHDLSYTNYSENKEIFDKIGWSKNDHYLFYTFNFGDENVYSKENLQEILEYKKSKNQYYNLNLDISSIFNKLKEEMNHKNTYISILFFAMFITAICNNQKNRVLCVGVFLVTLGTNLLFIILNRNMLRVVLPEYIIGVALLIYYLEFREKNINENKDKIEQSKATDKDRGQLEKNGTKVRTTRWYVN